MTAPNENPRAEVHKCTLGHAGMLTARRDGHEVIPDEGGVGVFDLDPAHIEVTVIRDFCRECSEAVAD